MTCSVKGNANDDEHHDEHDDSGESFHGDTWSIARLAALFRIARSVQGSADENEGDDNHECCDDNFHF